MPMRALQRRLKQHRVHEKLSILIAAFFSRIEHVCQSSARGAQQQHNKDQMYTTSNWIIGSDRFERIENRSRRSVNRLHVLPAPLVPPRTTV